MRIKLTIQYDGADFCGFQTQPQKRTVQSELEAAIYKVTGTSSRVTASGRTDAGVHAIGQIAHFDTDKDLGEKYVGALNFYLPPDVRVTDAKTVDESFHARFSSKKKTYVYVMYESKTGNPLLGNRAVRVENKLNVKRMNEAAKLFLGKHDFAEFRSLGSDALTTKRTVFDANVKRKDGLVLFSVTADGFLYNMVRKMAAALIDVGNGRMSQEQISDLLSLKATFTKVAPAHGLYLYKVVY